MLDQVRIKLISSDLENRLLQLSNMGIILTDLTFEDGMTLCFTTNRRLFLPGEKLLRSKGDQVSTLGIYGLGKRIRDFFHRPIFAVMLLLLLCLTLYLPTRVLFVRIQGNNRVADQKILRFSEDAGIRFGAGVRAVRSERVKNYLLAAIPELSWVGVNTKGCVATISVAERQTSEIAQMPMEVSSLVASRDAIVTQVTATRGSPLCKSGDVVRRGQVLISGYTDLGLKLQATRAQGEVFGQTHYDATLLFPKEYRKKGELTGIYKNYFLQIGKKEIKIWKDSGISPILCDKMYRTKYMALPGGFYLPLGITVETIICYEDVAGELLLEDAQPLMERSAYYYLHNAMISGQILEAEQSITAGEAVFTLDGHYRCLEMIGRIRHEEIKHAHEQIDRTDRKR